MSVVVTSVIILFALIFLGFFLGKGKVVQRDSIPEMSNLVIQVTMPATVFCSIINQQSGFELASFGQMIVGSLALYALSYVITLIATKPIHLSKEDRSVWLYTGLLSNSGFMGLPLALAIFGSEGMFFMAIGNIFCNLLIFSVGTLLLTRDYPARGKFGLRQMIFNNINIAVVLGFIFLLTGVPVPGVISQFLTYLADITSGLSMLVVGLSISRLKFREVFSEKKIFFLPVLRLLIIPLVVVLIFRVLPIEVNPIVQGCIILTAALPASSAQSMITEQYHANTAESGRAVFITTLFSVVSVPLIMMLAF